MADRSLALVIAHSAHLRESLAVLLQALPQVGRVEQAAEIVFALALDLKPEPGLVLFDNAPPSADLLAGLTQLKARWPQAHYLVLVEDEQESLNAGIGGADVVVVKGIHPARLLETVEDLLSAMDGQTQANGSALGVN